MKRGLVMEGGAMRGMFTCGVLDVFLENEITFDGAAGISAGAVFGCNFKSKQIGRALRYNKKYCKDPRYCSFRSLLKTGNLYGVEFCYHELPEILDPFDHNTFEANPLEFYVGATDVQTGKCIYHKCSNGRETDLKWMQASASMPGVSRPVFIGGRLLLDGGITDAVPYACMERLGYDRNVIILTQPREYRKKDHWATPLFRAALHRYPVLAAAMAARSKVYGQQIAAVNERDAAGISLVIRPPKPLGISRTEHHPEELQRVYDLGRSEAEKNLERVRNFLA